MLKYKQPSIRKGLIRGTTVENTAYTRIKAIRRCLLNEIVLEHFIVIELASKYQNMSKNRK